MLVVVTAAAAAVVAAVVAAAVVAECENRERGNELSLAALPRAALAEGLESERVSKGARKDEKASE